MTSYGCPAGRRGGIPRGSPPDVTTRMRMDDMLRPCVGLTDRKRIWSRDVSSTTAWSALVTKARWSGRDNGDPGNGQSRTLNKDVLCLLLAEIYLRPSNHIGSDLSDK